MFNKAFPKFRKGRIRGIVREGTAKTYDLNFGQFGLFALEKGNLTAPQLEECRRILTREMDKGGKLWIRTFPDISKTSKATGVRMGRGRGAISHYVARVREGMTILEVAGVNADVAKRALLKAEKVLPVKGKFFQRPAVLRPDFDAIAKELNNVSP